MTSNNGHCIGKQSWPELVGGKANVAVATIEAENPKVQAIAVPADAFVTTDFRCDRVRVRVDNYGVVVAPPTVG